MSLKTVIHNIYNTGRAGYRHSITIIDSEDKIEEGKQVGYTEIARLGNYAATSPYYSELPEVFKIEIPTSFEVRKRTNKSLKHFLKLIS